jgi:hypothetical protein
VLKQSSERFIFAARNNGPFLAFRSCHVVREVTNRDGRFFDLG